MFIIIIMADGFDSHAVSSSELSNTKVETDCLSLKDKISISEMLNDESIKNIEVGSKYDGSLRCSLKIEVIDDTAMIDISQVGKSCSVDKKSNRGRRNRKKMNANHEKEIGEKMIARGRSMVEANSEKRVYCRKELENLRFVGMEEQRKMWVEIYCGLADTVQKEYDGLLHSNNTQKQHIRQHLGKENSPVISGGLAAKERGKHMKVYTQRGMTYMNLQNTLCLPGH